MLKDNTLHGMTRKQVKKLWRHLRDKDTKKDTKFVPPGVWSAPRMPDWIKLLYTSARS